MNMMTLNEYNESALATAIYGEGQKITYPTLGLAGEAGEFANLVKKLVAHGHEISKEEFIDELGDVLWYWVQGCTALGYTPQEVMEENIKKLEARYPNGFEVSKSEHRKEGDI